jgi:hypothetical protein
MDVSIIFVNWNSVEYLRNCIAGIHENTTRTTFEIIVVDNASPKGDINSLKPFFPSIRIIKSQENLGFARANNLGCHYASGEYVLLLNPDTESVGPAIDTLLDRAKVLPDAGIMGCRHVNPDLTVQTTTIQKFPTILNQIFNIEYLRRRWPACRLWELAPLFSDLHTPIRVEVIPGACMLLKREVFELVGMFSEQYFMYGEDIDLNYKVAQTGLKNYYIPDAVIIHYGGCSSKQQAVSQWATSMKYRAMDQYYVKRRGRFYAAMYRAAMAGCAIVRLLFIGLILPIAVQRRQALRSAAAKWRAILRWACGLDNLP